MTSSKYGTAELQGDASPSPPTSYRLSKVAKIALALIACGAAVIAHPVTRKATTSFHRYPYFGYNFPLADYPGAGLGVGRSAGDAAPVASTTIEDQVQDLQGRVTSIEKYLQATSGSGGSGNSRGSASRAMGLSGAVANTFAARRRLRGDQDSGGSDNSRVLDAYGRISNVYDSDGNRDGTAPVASTPLKDQVKNLQTRVAAIEKYLQAAGGSGNSRKQYHGVNGVFYNADYGW